MWLMGSSAQDPKVARFGIGTNKSGSLLASLWQLDL